MSYGFARKGSKKTAENPARNLSKNMAQRRKLRRGGASFSGAQHRVEALHQKLIVTEGGKLRIQNPPRHG